MGRVYHEQAQNLKPTVGLTRFLFLMNVCEKSAALINVYNGFMPCEKDAIFSGMKKLFVLQAVPAQFQPTSIIGGRA